MLAKKYRLNLAKANWRHRASDFQLSSASFKVIAKKSTSADVKIGILVTGKVGKANKRNQIKRWLAEALAEKLDQFPKGFEFIFIAYPPKEESSYETIRSSLNQVLPKISLLG